MRSTISLGALAFAASLGCVAVAQSADSAHGPVVSAYSGGEVDDDDGSRIDLGLSVSTPGGTTYTLAGSHADVDSEAGPLVSTAAAAALEHDFGRFGLSGGIRQVREADVSKALTWLGSVYADVEPVRLGAAVEWRNIDFDDTPFTVSGSDLGLTGVTTATGTAACSLTSTGYGVNGRLNQPRWSLYGSAIAYNYSGYDCASTLTALTVGGSQIPVTAGSRAPIAVRHPVIFQRVAANVTRAFDGLTASRIPRETALLESTLMLGTEVTTSARTTVGAEAYRDADEFAPTKTTTFLAYLDWRVTEAVSITSTIGTSDSDSLGRLQFLGLRATASFSR